MEKLWKLICKIAFRRRPSYEFAPDTLETMLLNSYQQNKKRSSEDRWQDCVNVARRMGCTDTKREDVSNFLDRHFGKVK